MADKLREAITCGALVPGDDLPSVSELARLQGLKPGTIQHAFLELAEEGLLVIRHGRTAQVAGTRPRTVAPSRGTGLPGRVQVTTARCPAASRMPAIR
jgi:DNA-binding GntR family transcriptional regulator